MKRKEKKGRKKKERGEYEGRRKKRGMEKKEGRFGEKKKGEDDKGIK